jgi:lipopolysaccharide export system permease protein
MSSADRLGLRLSKTPTTTQALRCFSGLPLFMVNSIGAPTNDKLPLAWRLGDISGIIGKSGRKSQNISVVMVFRRSLVRELTATAVGLFLILLGILFTNLVLRLLARAAGGTVAPEAILALLGFNAVFYFNILFSVALFVTVLLTLSRWYRDSEMVVWFTSGQGLTAWLKPILLFATPFLIAIFVLSLWLSPWAERRRLEYERQVESREEVALLTPGLFKEFRQARLVVFIESINSFDNTIHNIFLHSVDNGKDVTTVARSGHLEDAPNGDRFIVLEDGRRYEGQPGTATFRTIGFERLGRRIEPAEVRAGPLSVKALPIEALIASGGAVERAELFWRLSVPISAVVLVLLAIPLSYVNPRMGRSFNLISAAFMYMVYNNCVNFVQSVIAQGRLSLAGGLILTHSVAIAIVIVMFWNRLSISGLMRRRRIPG